MNPMTTLHLRKDDIASMVVDDDGNVTIELTEEASQELAKLALSRSGQKKPTVQVNIQPAQGNTYEDGRSAGFAHGLNVGRTPRR